MADLDTLRPEVRDALMHIRPSAHRFEINSWNCVRAELLRLAALEHAWQQWIKDGMRVEFMPPEQPK